MSSNRVNVLHFLTAVTNGPPYTFGRVDAWLFNVMCHVPLWRSCKYASTAGSPVRDWGGSVASEEEAAIAPTEGMGVPHARAKYTSSVQSLSLSCDATECLRLSNVYLITIYQVSINYILNR